MSISVAQTSILRTYVDDFEKQKFCKYDPELELKVDSDVDEELTVTVLEELETPPDCNDDDDGNA